MKGKGADETARRRAYPGHRRGRPRGVDRQPRGKISAAGGTGGSGGRSMASGEAGGTAGPR
ncbi:hypothetical protein B1T44_24585 [Mycobacterium persicum]|nr:hypothetical protein B1T44_24585 [Mycobacterium persicum]